MQNEPLREIVEAIVTRRSRTKLPTEPEAHAGIDRISAAELQRVLAEELLVNVSVERLEQIRSVADLTGLVAPNLLRDQAGRTIVDIYTLLGRIVSEEINGSVKYRWYTRWTEYFSTGVADSLDDVEIVMRLEEELGFEIHAEDQRYFEIVNETVRYLWQKSSGNEASPRNRTPSKRLSA